MMAASPVLAVMLNTAGHVPAFVADPTAAYLLTLIGMYGLIFELSAPGGILPGVLGGSSLILGLLGLSTLPVNYAGLALILFSLLLFLADVKMPSHGVLTAGGVISMFAGSMALFNTGQSGLAIGLPVILVMTAGTALLFGTIVRLGLKARKAVPATGIYALVGKVGEVREPLHPPLHPVGRVVVNGEWWKATSDESLDAGARVEVLGVRGLTLLVRRH